MAAAAAQYDEKERETIKASLKSWWSNFTKTGKGASKERKGALAYAVQVPRRVRSGATTAADEMRLSPFPNPSPNV